MGDVFRDQNALSALLTELNQKVREKINLPSSTDAGTHLVGSDTRISDIWLRQTADTAQAREELLRLVMIGGRRTIKAKSIKKMSVEEMEHEVQRDASIVAYHVVTRIWY